MGIYTYTEQCNHVKRARGNLQVHRAVLKVGSKRRNVVVKVRHPGVACQIAQDFQLLQPIAGLTSQVLPPSVSTICTAWCTCILSVGCCTACKCDAIPNPPLPLYWQCVRVGECV